MNDNSRGFNFIADFASRIPAEYSEYDTNEDILNAIKYLSRQKDIGVFQNYEIAAKRFIAWFYNAYKERYTELVELDSTGFLKKCSSLYDPTTNKYPIPKHCYDYSCTFDY